MPLVRAPRRALLSTTEPEAKPRVLYESQPITLSLLVASGARLQRMLTIVAAGGLGAGAFFEYFGMGKALLGGVSLVLYGSAFEEIVRQFNARFVDSMLLVEPGIVEIKTFGDPAPFRLALKPVDAMPYVTKVRDMKDGLLAVDASNNRSLYVIVPRGKIVDPLLSKDFLVDTTSTDGSTR